MSSDSHNIVDLTIGRHGLGVWQGQSGHQLEGLREGDLYSLQMDHPFLLLKKLTFSVPYLTVNCPSSPT